MFLGDTVPPAIVIVFVATAPDGGELGLVAELEGLELFEPQATSQPASVSDVSSAPRRAKLRIASLDRKNAPA